MGHNRNASAACGPGGAPWRRWRRLACVFRRKDDGAAAIEFAMVAAPFFLMLSAIFETALVFFSTQILENAVADASRRFYTGEFQQTHQSVSDPATLQQHFKNDVCSRVTLFDCQATLKVDISTHKTFPSGGFTAPIKDGEIDPSFGQYQTAPGDTYVLVRVAGARTVFMAMMTPYLSNLNGNRRLVMASAAFKTEPF
ncbi:MAG TPA: TadE/TadG family type IV pilus assembly protein [Microvirga sp.]|jgi:Flp pilus assembly protein TadG